MSNELDQEQVILKNHVIAGSYLIAAMYKLKRLRWKFKFKACKFCNYETYLSYVE
jgi:hypothetical protein